MFYPKILEEHKLQGEEDEALEKRVGKKKAAAKKRATRKSGQLLSLSVSDMTLTFFIARSKNPVVTDENDSE
jgi:hypothetical protein